MMINFIKNNAAWVVIISAGLSLCAQRPTFHAVTRLVQVPVEVFDSNGQFVPDLTKNDFQLRINGKLWPIANLDKVHGGERASMPAQKPRRSFPFTPSAAIATDPARRRGAPATNRRNRRVPERAVPPLLVLPDRWA